MSDVEEVRAAAATLMPEILQQLERMVGVSSVAFPGYPPEPVHEMAATVLDLFQAAGISNAAPGSARRLSADLRGARRAARVTVVVLYAHYDVQPAPPEQGWTSIRGFRRARTTVASTGEARPTTRAGSRSI